MAEIDRFKTIVEKLRSENGCAWDRAQTHTSLKAACIEEAAEVVGVINILEHTGDSANFKEEAAKKYDAVIVDECQFLRSEQVDWLSDLVDYAEIPVICYGLRTDFQSKFFPGSKRLMEIADKI